MTGQVEPTNYTADIVRRQKKEVADDNSSKGVVKEAEEEEKLGQDVDNIGERRLMVGRVYIYDKERS